MTKVLVTGKNGQVARCLADEAANFQDLELIFGARSEADVFLDLTNFTSIVSAVEKTQPDIVINAAAYTAVDEAEDYPDLAMKINGTAAGVLAKAADQINALLIQISTDYVFDGSLDRPYRPTDQVNPIGVYGKTKLAGEIAAKANCKNCLIARTAWVYSPYGKNFYKTMLKLSEQKKEISVIADQHGNPTPAQLIATELLRLCRSWKNGNLDPSDSIIHIVGEHTMTWYTFAKWIFNKNGIDCKVIPISTGQYPTKAVRPKNSRLAR